LTINLQPLAVLNKDLIRIKKAEDAKVLAVFLLKNGES
jgi:hypothetical protein